MIEEAYEAKENAFKTKIISKVNNTPPQCCVVERMEILYRHVGNPLSFGTLDRSLVQGPMHRFVCYSP